MNKIEIGNTAGQIWHLLDEEGDILTTDIQKKLNISEQLLYLAIGWLCREGKIHCIETGKAKGGYICSKNIPNAFFG